MSHTHFILRFLTDIPITRDIIDNRYSSLIFEFYTADTFEPHPDAARPSMTLSCHPSVNLVIPLLEAEDNISEYGAAIMDTCGDVVFFVLSDFSAGGMTPLGWPRDELYYCICWREGRLVPVSSNIGAT